MATPVGHALAGYAVYCTKDEAAHGDLRLLGLCLLLAVSPDLDFLPGILEGQPALYHQGISHSLGFAVGAGLGAALLYGRSQRALLSSFLVFTLAYSSHLLIDLFGPDSRPPYGIPLFWPISNETYLAPFQMFWGVHHVSQTSDPTGVWVSNVLSFDNLGAVGVEIVLILPLVIAARTLRSRRKLGSFRASETRVYR